MVVEVVGVAGIGWQSCDSRGEQKTGGSAKLVGGRLSRGLGG